MELFWVASFSQLMVIPLNEIDKSFKTINQVDKPKLILARTTKGKGVDFMENDNNWHHGRLTESLYQEAIKSLQLMNLSLNRNLARQWSRIGPRGIYGQSLLSIAEAEEDIFAISADLGNSSGLDRFKGKFNERFINIGIAEQNMIGFSSGLSTLGFNVFVSSFAPFITMRAGEQVRMNLSYMQSNVKIVAIGSGISMGFLGNSHFGLEDISIIRSLPNIPIISPCDCFEVYKAVEALSKLQGPAFLRLTGAAPSPIINDNDYEFIIGKSIELVKGNDLLILSHGSIIGNCIKAAKFWTINILLKHLLLMFILCALLIKT